MSQQSPNPYAPPPIDSGGELSSLLAATLKTRDRVHFTTVITPEDLLSAIDARADRHGLMKFRRIGLVALALILLFLVAAVATGGSLAAPGRTMWVQLGGMLCLFACSAWMHWGLRRKFVRINQSQLGPRSGWIDCDGAWLESPSHACYRPIDQVVGVSATQETLVLYFDRALTLFETLPMRGFEDRESAELLAQALVQMRPFCKGHSLDSRRLEPCQEKPRFQPLPEATFYSGRVMLSDVQGTTMARMHRKSLFLGWIQKLLILSAAVAFVLFVSPSSWLALVAIAMLVFVFVRSTLFIRRAPYLGQADSDVMLYSDGWLDRNGLVTLTRLGQSCIRWTGFDQGEFTDRLIALRCRDAGLWYLISRGQISDDASWKMAIQLTKDMLHPNDLQTATSTI